MEIRKKVDMLFFQEILEGKKKFELRLADFECKEGDILILEEWNTKTSAYTGRTLKKRVNYVMKSKDLNYWSKEDIEKYGFQVIQLDD